MAEKGKSKTPWPVKSQVRGQKPGKLGWVPHPNKSGWEINVMDMNERKIGGKRKK